MNSILHIDPFDPGEMIYIVTTEKMIQIIVEDLFENSFHIVEVDAEYNYICFFDPAINETFQIQSTKLVEFKNAIQKEEGE